MLAAFKASRVGGHIDLRKRGIDVQRIEGPHRENMAVGWHVQTVDSNVVRTHWPSVWAVRRVRRDRALMQLGRHYPHLAASTGPGAHAQTVFRVYQRGGSVERHGSVVDVHRCQRHQPLGMLCRQLARGRDGVPQVQGRPLWVVHLRHGRGVSQHGRRSLTFFRPRQHEHATIPVHARGVAAGARAGHLQNLRGGGHQPRGDLVVRRHE